MEELVATLKIQSSDSLNYDDILHSISMCLRTDIQKNTYQNFELLGSRFEYLYCDEYLSEFFNSNINDIPSKNEVYNYLQFLSYEKKFSIGSWILTLAYLKKNSAKIPFLASSWQKLVLCSLYNSQKINERHCLEHHEFIKNISGLTLIDFIFMNMEFQEAVEFQYEVSKDELMGIAELIMHNLETEWKINAEFIDKIQRRSKECSNINEMEANIHPSKRMYNIDLDKFE